MDTEARLREIERELRQGHAEQPEKMLLELMRDMRKETLSEWGPTLEPVIDRFQPKRRRLLREALDARIRGRPAEVREPTANSVYEASPTVEETDNEAGFREELGELSRAHIFQWATSYRDCLFRLRRGDMHSASSPRLL